MKFRISAVSGSLVAIQSPDAAAYREKASFSLTAFIKQLLDPFIFVIRHCHFAHSDHNGTVYLFLQDCITKCILLIILTCKRLTSLQLYREDNWSNVHIYPRTSQTSRCKWAWWIHGGRL